MGIFIWTTHSATDREVPQGPPTLPELSNSTRLLNLANDSAVRVILDG